MTNRNSHDRRDHGLLVAAAGLVVAGAAAIALIAGFAVTSEDTSSSTAAGRSDSTRPEFRTVSRAVPAQPVPMEGIEIESVPGPDDGAEPVEVEEPAFEIDPDLDPVAEGLAGWNERDYERAVAYFSRAAEQRPDRAWTHYILGLSQWKNGDPAAAADSLRRSGELDDTRVKTFVNLARVENDRGEFDSALVAADRAVEIAAENPQAGAEATFLRARSLYNLGRTEDATVALERSLTLEPENAYAENLLGLIHLERGESGPAVDHLAVAVALDPDVAYIQNNLGMALELQGDREGAVAAYRQAVALDPKRERAAVNLARLTASDPAVPEPTIESFDEVARLDREPAVAPEGE